MKKVDEVIEIVTDKEDLRRFLVGAALGDKDAIRALSGRAIASPTGAPRLADDVELVACAISIQARSASDARGKLALSSICIALEAVLSTGEVELPDELEADYYGGVEYARNLLELGCEELEPDLAALCHAALDSDTSAAFALLARAHEIVS